MNPLNTATIAEAKCLLKKLFSSEEPEIQALFAELSVFSLNEINDQEVVRLMKAMEFIELNTAQPIAFYETKDRLQDILASVD